MNQRRRAHKALSRAFREFLSSIRRSANSRRQLGAVLKKASLAIKSRSAGASAVTLFERFGRLQIGLARDSLPLIAARILNAVLILLYQLQPLLGDPLLRFVSPFLGTVSLSCG
jgi:hypothetical protein